MIVAVRDHISGFTLYSKRCDAESEESIREILTEIKKMFGTPSGSISDMRSGIISCHGVPSPWIHPIDCKCSEGTVS